ncbi:MAG: cardiolipin synthase [Ruminococcaceae bacterium]|nr:cardiolipin synthase [Oscillospiraceae bacterium]
MLLILFLINFLCIITVIFSDNKKPQETLAWILLLYIFPIGGVLVYILFGNPFPAYKKKKLSLREYCHFKDYIELNKKDILKDKKNISKNSKDLILFNFKNNLSIFSKDNTLTLFTDGYDKYKSLFSDILNAKYSINIEYYIIRNDKVGNDFVSLLTKKAKEGVKVNLLYDEFASAKTSLKMFKPLIDAGGNVHRFFNSMGINLIKVNNRNHRKIAVIDGKTGYIGGMNIGLEYMGLKRLTPWRDTHLKIEGSAVYSLQARFLNDLVLCTKNFKIDYKFYFPKVDFLGDKSVQIITSDPECRKEEIKYSFIKMINMAKKSIYIQTPYFVPDSAFLEALKIAALSGVDIRIMIPGKPDKKYIYYINMSYIDELIKYGVKFYILDAFLHSKTIVTDCEITSIGTSNFDIRSFTLNYEINAFIYDKEFAIKNVDAFLQDIKNSKLLTYEEFKKRSTFKKLCEKTLKLFSPLA